MASPQYFSAPALAFLGAAAVIIAAAYQVFSNSRREQPWPGFKLITVRDNSPKASYALHGREALAKGLQEVGRRSRIGLDQANYCEVFRPIPSDERVRSHHRFAKPLC